MLTNPERTAARRDTLIFVVCLLLSLVALALPGTWRGMLAGGLRRTVLLPLLELQQQTERLQILTGDLDAIIASRDSAVRAAQFLPQLRAENERLRGLLGLRALAPGTFVSAEVLHQTQPGGPLTILLAAGSAEGVTVLAPVVTTEGLVGVVTNVDRRTSVAMTWAHPEFRASATTADETLRGIVAPVVGRQPGSELLELRGVPYGDSVAVGTPVLTSGLGGVLPSGIPLGSVLGISREQTGWERSYFVLPAAHPSGVSHVLVVLNPSADLGPAFELGERRRP